MEPGPGLGLAGRRVVVTGGSRGIGAACCRLFARAGAAVAVLYRERRDEAGAVLAEARREAPDQPHLALAGDLADPVGVEAVFAEIGRRWGRIDHLVNNAGIWEANALADLDLDRYRRVLEINVTAGFLCARAALPLMTGVPEDGDEPSIVNVTSTAGQRGEAFHSPYAASKGAMISATKAWASELAPRVRVNSVAPGWVDTDMAAAALAEGEGERIAAGIPLGRVASAEDVAGPILFLASRLARHVTGEILNVNGGAVLVG
ncbi:MAG TPA: SDR family oxidoreductase [Thermoanaerobaculia bacterium]|nr:SDR family oxidoreductase [Thermoanaerobaculia bacterium]